MLTIIVKAILYPLNNKVYCSMAKMRTVAPKMEALKKQYGDDKMGLQQAMMKLYRNKKINPLGRAPRSRGRAREHGRRRRRDDPPHPSLRR